MFDGVLRDTLFAFGGDRAEGFGAIVAGGLALALCRVARDWWVSRGFHGWEYRSVFHAPIVNRREAAGGGRGCK